MEHRLPLTEPASAIDAAKRTRAEYVEHVGSVSPRFTERQVAVKEAGG
jgi:hypothetical protein